MPRGSGCGISSRARLAGAGIVQSYLQTTLVLLFIVPVSRLLFLKAVTSEMKESNRDSGLKLAWTKPFKMLAGASTMNVFLRQYLLWNTNNIYALVNIFNINSLTFLFLQILCLCPFCLNIVTIMFLWPVLCYLHLICVTFWLVRVRVCVIWPPCTTSWLIVLWSGPLVMRVTQYHTKEPASQGDSSSLAEPESAPSLHGRPKLKHTPPSFPYSLPPTDSPQSSLLFLTCMQAKTHAYSSMPSPVQRG